MPSVYLTSIWLSVIMFVLACFGLYRTSVTHNYVFSADGKFASESLNLWIYSWSFCWVGKTMSHIVFILIYYTDCERNKTYHLNSNIRRIMSTNSITARHQSFADISKPSHMWRWLEHDLRELIFSDHSHNLGSSIIIGNATKLEQVLLLAWYRILL